MAAWSAGILAEAVAAERGLAETLFAELASGSRDEPGVTRAPYGPGENMAHRLVTDAARRLGLEISSDPAANSYMTLRGRLPEAPRVLIGSHLDSVAHGGNFDGSAGVVAGLVAVAALKRLGLELECDVTVMGIRAEESVWFQQSYTGSRLALGTLPPGGLEAQRIDTGRSLAAHMAECGGDPEKLRGGSRHLDPAKIRAFLELHIEQAPSLVEAGLPVAICSGIPGNFRYPNVRIMGEYDHAGLPRRFRRDAAMAASEFAMSLDRIWEESEAAGKPMCFTIGRFHTDFASHAMTVVPGEFHFSLDVRAYDNAFLAELEERVVQIVADIERRRGVRFDLGRRAGVEIGRVDPVIRASLEAGARALGVPTMPLGSPANHDAAAFAASGVPIGMLFIRNENGSHNPAEAMEIDDFLAGTSVLTWWLAENLVGLR
jgi:N-carbamoyl-L-amino-acid hydrolase